jgi:hypothetical protein
MMRHLFKRPMTCTAVIAALTIAALAAATSPAVAVAGHGLPWSTCTPQQTYYAGMYRVDNDLFTGAPGQSCITSTTGRNLIISTSYTGRAKFGVVAYPDIRVGSFYRSRDRLATFLPVQVAALSQRRHRIAAQVSAVGSASGKWLADADLWFYDSPVIRGHGTAEVVIATRYTFRTACQVMLRAGRREHRRAVWCANLHQTRARRGWPVIVVRLVHQQDSRRIPVSSLLRRLRRLGWLPGSKWLGSIAYGAECWQGCKGLTLAMTISAPGVPGG